MDSHEKQTADVRSGIALPTHKQADHETTGRIHVLASPLILSKTPSPQEDNRETTNRAGFQYVIFHRNQGSHLQFSPTGVLLLELSQSIYVYNAGSKWMDG